MQIGEYIFKRMSSGCPEEYAVYDKEDNRVGYVHLRRGVLYAQTPWRGGVDIYYAHVGNWFTGRFKSDKQRLMYLTRIAKRISRSRFKVTCSECKCVTRMMLGDLNELDKTGKTIVTCRHCGGWITVRDDGNGLVAGRM